MVVGRGNSVCPYNRLRPTIPANPPRQLRANLWMSGRIEFLNPTRRAPGRRRTALEVWIEGLLWKTLRQMDGEAAEAGAPFAQAPAVLESKPRRRIRDGHNGLD